MYCRTCEDYYKRIGRTKNNLLKHMVRRGRGQEQEQEHEQEQEQEQGHI